MLWDSNADFWSIIKSIRIQPDNEHVIYIKEITFKANNILITPSVLKVIDSAKSLFFENAP